MNTSSFLSKGTPRCVDRSGVFLIEKQHAVMACCSVWDQFWIKGVAVEAVIRFALMELLL